MAVWYNLWSLGIFSRFGIFGPRKIWQPWSKVYWTADAFSPGKNQCFTFVWTTTLYLTKTVEKLRQNS
jgi:hypothetical protein